MSTQKNTTQTPANTEADGHDFRVVGVDVHRRSTWNANTSPCTWRALGVGLARCTREGFTRGTRGLGAAPRRHGGWCTESNRAGPDHLCHGCFGRLAFHQASRCRG